MKPPLLSIRSSKDLGLAIARARNAKGLSQREVAARLGVTQAWVSKVEQGSSRAWLDKALELAHFVEVSLYAAEGKPQAAEAFDAKEPSIDEILGEAPVEPSDNRSAER